MSILIKGMEMPKDGCHHIICIYADGAVATGGRAYMAVTVPPHVWVSVADGLPEDGEDVLCWICNDAMGDRYATVGHYDTTFRMWDLDSENALSRHVTHWTPIPMPPRD